MIYEDYVKEMIDIANNSGGDKEASHSNADDLIIKFLIENGFTDLSYAYNQVNRWYA